MCRRRRLDKLENATVGELEFIANALLKKGAGFGVDEIMSHVPKCD